ncbi:MAG TPA: hypothetical protein VIM81_02070 [Gammaproteobacteria bacterium]
MSTILGPPPPPPVSNRDRKRWIERSWQRYLRMVVPADAPDVQVNETRQAFFAGAAILFTALQFGVSEGDEVQPADERLMADIQAEIDTFGEQIDRKVLGSTEH